MALNKQGTLLSPHYSYHEGLFPAREQSDSQSLAWKMSTHLFMACWALLVLGQGAELSWGETPRSVQRVNSLTLVYPDSILPIRFGVKIHSLLRTRVDFKSV